MEYLNISMEKENMLDFKQYMVLSFTCVLILGWISTWNKNADYICFKAAMFVILGD